MTNQPLDVLLLRDAEAGYEAIGLQYCHVLEWERDVESFNHFENPAPYHQDGLRLFELPIFRGRGNLPVGAATDGGEAMTWHDEFTETVQPDWVESVDTIAYNKSLVEAISYWNFDGKCHDGFVATEGTPGKSYHRLQALLAKCPGEG